MMKGDRLRSLEATDNYIDNRSYSDRRDFSWRTVFYGYLRSRRRTTRRLCEGEALFTDYHHPWLFFLATGIMVLSCVDAMFTLQLIGLGAVEINPIMAAVIGKGTMAFAITKMLLTSFGILALVFLARRMFMQRIRTGLLLTIIFNIYAILVCYEFIYLIRHY